MACRVPQACPCNHHVVGVCRPALAASAFTILPPHRREAPLQRLEYNIVMAQVDLRVCGLVARHAGVLNALDAELLLRLGWGRGDTGQRNVGVAQLGSAGVERLWI